LAGRRADPLLALHFFTLILGNTAVFAVGALGAWSIVSRALWGWTERESAALRSATRWWAGGGLTLTLLGVVLGSVWARGHMGRFWSWDVRELGALGVLLWNGLMLGLLTRRSHSERLVMLLGQAGNVVVALCWLGPAFQRFAQQFNGSILAAVSTPLAIFLLIELFVVGLTFVRPGQMNISRG
jgi:ABC-type transport system involved in cytochrome c biogenesis permease subunit